MKAVLVYLSSFLRFVSVLCTFFSYRNLFYEIKVRVNEVFPNLLMSADIICVSFRQLVHKMFISSNYIMATLFPYIVFCCIFLLYIKLFFLCIILMRKILRSNVRYPSFMRSGSSLLKWANYYHR